MFNSVKLDTKRLSKFHTTPTCGVLDNDNSHDKRLPEQRSSLDPELDFMLCSHIVTNRIVIHTRLYIQWSSAAAICWWFPLSYFEYGQFSECHTQRTHRTLIAQLSAGPSRLFFVVCLHPSRERDKLHHVTGLSLPNYSYLVHLHMMRTVRIRKLMNKLQSLHLHEFC